MEVPQLHRRAWKQYLLIVFAVLSFATTTFAQSLSTSLGNLPEADVLIYVSPQRILNDAAPKVMSAKNIEDMRNTFAQIKGTIGFDPTNVEYLVIAVRFHKPAGDLSFVAPDIMAVAGGDFSADSLLTLAQLSAQDRIRTEKHGAKTITTIKVDPIAAEAEKTPILKAYSELGAVALTPNSIGIGNIRYLKSAIDAVEGGGRIRPETVQSLMRDPNVLLAATGSPLLAFVRSFGMLGTETTPREGRCDSNFGNFYAAVTMSGANYSLRGAMNADNPDTAKIITGLLSSLMKHGIEAVPDKGAQTALQSIRLLAKDNEIVIEGDIPGTMIADLFKSETKPKEAAAPKTAPAKPPVRRTKRRN
jgi:hypothetical protein